MSHTVTGKDLPLTVEVDHLGENQRQLVRRVDHACSTKHSEHLRSRELSHGAEPTLADRCYRGRFTTLSRLFPGPALGNQVARPGTFRFDG